MIKITIELLPFGSEKHKKHLGTAIITNIGSGTKYSGNYKYNLSKKGNPKNTWREGKISGFPRKKLGAYDLLFRVLRDVVSERNIK